VSEEVGPGELAVELDRLAAAERFSGVVHVERDGRVVLAAAYGLADRAHGIANTVDTRFGVASGTKGLTALTVMSLVVDGVLAPDTPARRWLGDDLPLIPADVTVEHLLGHRSGIGDYLDEDLLDDVEEYVMAVPAQRLATTEDYLAVLGGFPTKFPADEAFSYCNGGYVVLALIAERASATPFAELVERRVCTPAGMTRTEFLRSDELPGDVALGYVTAGDDLRTNVFHLPVRGSGDGGIHTTADDVARLWRALDAGLIVPSADVAEMVRPRSTAASGDRYGLGFWLHPTSEVVHLEGADAGVSFRSVHDPVRGLTHTVLSNTTDGAWPIARFLADALGTR
jgi:CubicO group peptidase (beta-lactamase class C family)